MTSETVQLTGDSAGTRRSLTCHRFGPPGAAPVVYLQAGLHADEMPGVLVLLHLLPLLAAARVTGEIRVVPCANPVGLSQWAFQRPLGRIEAESLHNFNRGWPELAALAGDRLEGRLGPDADRNRDAIRAAFREAVAGLPATSDAAEWRRAILSWSCDADYVLDLHCDHFAVMHLYASPARPADTSLLCRSVGAELALIQDVSGGNAFDEAHTVPWLRLRERFGDRFPVPAGCFSATLEYRGQFDVSDDLAAADARNLMTFLAAIGAVADWPDRPAYPDAPHLPLGGAAEVFAPQGGVVTWAAGPGAKVARGATIAHVTDQATGRRAPVEAPVDGLLFRTELWRACLRGASLCHVAGAEIVREGHLLSD